MCESGGYDFFDPANNKIDQLARSNAEPDVLKSREVNKDKLQMVQIVSPPFACGVAWLINALLHLDIKVTNPNFDPGHWIKSDGAWEMSKNASTHLKFHLPTLHDRQRFHFPEELEVRWEHRLDFANDGLRPTILFVRDPRDAVYSLYKRDYHENMEFLQYLNKPDEWPDHFPRLFQMPPLETFAYFAWYWLEMGKLMPVKVVRFEDVKSNPMKVLSEVLQYLGVERSEAQMAEAIESSSIKNAKHAMQKTEAETGKKFKTVRKGEVGEWRKTYSSYAESRVEGIGEAIIQQLGYQGSLKVGLPVFDDYRKVVSRKIPAEIRGVVIAMLLATESGNVPTSKEIAAIVQKFAISGENLLKMGVIAEAIFYVENIFSNTDSEQARTALNTFINLNLYFFDQWPVLIAAKRALKRIQLQSGVPILGQLGEVLNSLNALERMLVVK